MIALGIDPGLDGALAVLSEKVEVFDTPTLLIQGAKGNRREYNLALMWAVVSGINKRPGGIQAAYIEQVHAMPGQGVRSMFTMGYGVGAWEGLLAALGVPYVRVTPQRWKKLILADQGKDKDASRFKAIQLFPEYASLFARKKDDGRADAVLIAEYGRRQG